MTAIFIVLAHKGKDVVGNTSQGSQSEVLNMSCLTKAHLGQHVTVLTGSPRLVPPVAQAFVNPTGQSPSVVYNSSILKEGGMQSPVGVLPSRTGVGVPYMLLK